MMASPSKNIRKAYQLNTQGLLERLIQLEDQAALYQPLVGELAKLPGMQGVLERLQIQIDVLSKAREENAIRFAKYEDMHMNIGKLLTGQSLAAERLLGIEGELKYFKTDLNKVSTFIDTARVRSFDALMQVIIKIIPWVIAISAGVFALIQSLK